MSKILHSKSAMIGLGLIVLIMSCALLAGVLSPNNPMTIDMNYRFAQRLPPAFRWEPTRTADAFFPGC